VEPKNFECECIYQWGRGIFVAITGHGCSPSRENSGELVAAYLLPHCPLLYDCVLYEHY
jgi:hypothetical protein